MKYLIVLLSLLAACAGVSKEQEELARTEMSRGMDICFQDFSVTSYFEYAVCMNQVTEQYFQAVDFPYPEIVPMANSYHLALAERVMGGEITPEQASLIWRQVFRELLAQASVQHKAAAERASQWRQLIWAINTNYALRTPIYCTQMGNMITCN